MGSPAAVAAAVVAQQALGGTGRPSTTARPPSISESVAAQTGELCAQEVIAFQFAIQGVLGASLKAAGKLEGQIAHLRTLCNAFTHYAVSRVWPDSVPKPLFIGSPNAASARVQRYNEKVNENLESLKDLHEKKIQPALQSLKLRYMGRTFIKDETTPRELLLVSRPVDKKDKDLSFETLQKSISKRVYNPGNTHAQLLEDTGTARICLTRTVAGLTETIEFAYKRDGKVTIIQDGKKVGSMWTDDALAVAERFISGKNFQLKRKPTAEYVVC